MALTQFESWLLRERDVRAANDSCRSVFNKVLEGLDWARSSKPRLTHTAELALLAEEAHRLAEWTAAPGGLEDVYRRTTVEHKLPHMWPEGEPVEELDEAGLSASRRRSRRSARSVEFRDLHNDTLGVLRRVQQGEELTQFLKELVPDTTDDMPL